MVRLVHKFLGVELCILAIAYHTINYSVSFAVVLIHDIPCSGNKFGEIFSNANDMS